jgi:hypothetical protein
MFQTILNAIDYQLPALDLSKESKYDINDFIYHGIELNSIRDFENYDFGESIFNNNSEHMMNIIKKQINNKNIGMLSSNPAAAEWLLKNPKYIRYAEFSANIHPKAVAFMLRRPNMIDWEWFSSNCNPKAVDYILKNKSKAKIEWLCSNTDPRIIAWLETLVDENHPDLCWKKISKNVGCRKIILNNLEKVEPKMMGKNPAMAEYILEEIQKGSDIYDTHLSANSHPLIIEHLANNLDKIFWRQMCSNRNGIALLSYNKHDIVQSSIHTNPMAFKQMGLQLPTGWSASFFEYCYWHPYRDQYVKRDSLYQVTSKVKPAKNLTKEELSLYHYYYLTVLIEHEKLEKELLVEFNCVDGYHLDLVLYGMIEKDPLSISPKYHPYKDLKSKRKQIAHVCNINDLLKCHTLNKGRDEFIASLTSKPNNWKQATQYIEILCEYKWCVQTLSDYFNGKKSSEPIRFGKLISLMEQDTKQPISLDYFMYIVHTRRAIAHCSSWEELPSI